ncbi:DivIVA domain-containing protein [Dactylosporangium salmoneum]|uniref:DivIVA domain-containing protein n=1 Tax=Dactylosporangium salmoneum TaxID=53361 RepID=A0ABP5U0U2_9ACTN
MVFEFAVVLRGYDPREVDALLVPAVAALESGSEQVRAEAAAALRRANLPVVLRGFDRAQVDGAIAGLASRLGGSPEPTPSPGRVAVEFARVLRGYDMAAVDRLVEQVEGALAAGNAGARAEAAAAVRNAAFALKFGGYDRHEVDRYLEQAARELG